MTQALKPNQLYSACDISQFEFETTAELEDLEELIGQLRAQDALEFGVGIGQKGYNLFVMGPSGVGKHTMLRTYLQQQAEKQATPPDWVYVDDFKHPEQPRAIALPAGRGTEFCNDMRQLVEDLRSAIPSAFETEQYHARLREIHDGLQERTHEAFSKLAEEAEKLGLVLIRVENEITFAPTKKGRALSPEEFAKLPEEEQKRIEQAGELMSERLQAILNQRPQWQRELRQSIKALNREVGLFAVGHLIEDLRQRYEDIEEIGVYLAQLQEDVIENLNEFLVEDSQRALLGKGVEPVLRRYQVNLFVDNSDLKGVPVVYEDLPRVQNLAGRMEYTSQMGVLTTDYMMLKPGSLHKANGGYLIIDVQKLLLQPFAWEGLKRLLFAGKIRIQSPGEIYGLITTQSLEPEQIPLELKLVLVGERIFYYLLQAYDPEFSELFKVMVDFEDAMPRDAESQQLFARFIATLARKEKLLDFDRNAVARVIEHGVRLAEDKEKLSMHMMKVADLLREADHWAREAKRNMVTAEDVQCAIDKHIRREDRMRERMLEEIQRGTILLDTDGETIAQINGLFVIELGTFAFASPSRITATVRLGEGEVVDIEREVELGGAIHSKGVLILSSFLAARYAQNYPLSLAASLVFEQSYGGVEGDSASVGELCALLSALAETPVRQWLAVTGSVNQHGQVQAIGGVNEKIEGFFEVCKRRGLNGQHGVVIPASNETHLMLRQEVVEAAERGEFHIYPVTTVDEAIALLTGVPAGEKDEAGHYAENTINYKVNERLKKFAEVRHDFAKHADEHSEDVEES